MPSLQVPGLSLPEQFTLVNAPIDPFDPRQRGAFLEFTGAYAAGQPVLFNEGLMPAGPPASEPQMADAESLHKVGSLEGSYCQSVWTYCFPLSSACLLVRAESLHKLTAGVLDRHVL